MLNFVYCRKYLNDLVQNVCSHRVSIHTKHEIVLKLSNLDKISVEVHIEIADSMIPLKESLPAISNKIVGINELLHYIHNIYQLHFRDYIVSHTSSF